MHFLGQKAEGEKQERILLFPINTADSSRRAFCFKSGLFVFFHLQNFALKIYTSLFKNQTRSAKKKPIQNPEKRPEREVSHSRTPAQSPCFPLSSITCCTQLQAISPPLHPPQAECEAPCSPSSHTGLLLPLATLCRAQLAPAFKIKF